MDSWGYTAISTTALLTGHGYGHADPESLATHPRLRTFGGGLLKGQAPPSEGSLRHGGAPWRGDLSASVLASPRA